MKCEYCAGVLRLRAIFERARCLPLATATRNHVLLPSFELMCVSVCAFYDTLLVSMIVDNKLTRGDILK
ncbi:hypothetical protein V5799_021317 [Amblyomma americanum]|uniref:Uncharacterized protein n=1 Tax=Amblyomma americanum TaxID=6943 RepID=A0AAQ4FNJ6_AMBAM